MTSPAAASTARRQHSNLQLNQALQLVVLEKGQSENMKLTGGKIFVITAGMMSENTAAHNLAMRMAGDEKAGGIFFVGYADPGTPGGRLKAAKDGETFVFSPSAGRLTRKCEIQDFDLTAHANRDDLLDFVGQVSPRAVLLGHGDDPQIAVLAAQDVLRSRLRLCIIDGFKLMAHGGPLYKHPEYVVPHEAVYVSTDPVALDALGGDLVEKARAGFGLKSLTDEGRPRPTSRLPPIWASESRTREDYPARHHPLTRTGRSLPFLLSGGARSL